MNNIAKIILVILFDLKRKHIFNKKISKIYKLLKSKTSISAETKMSHKMLWAKLNSKPNLKWLTVYTTINGIKDYRYITEYDYYTKVEPVLNNRTFSEAFSDKNFYHKYIDNQILPKIFIRNIQGEYYSEDYSKVGFPEDLSKYIPKDIKKLIVKIAVDSGGGRGVFLFEKKGLKWINKNGYSLNLKHLETVLGKNFIIQEYIQQHPFYSRFNKSSVNSIRVFTYRSVITNDVIHLHSVLRIGQLGAIVDNQASGGIACGIKSDGRLNNFAVNKYGCKFDYFNGLKFSQVGPLFKYHEIVALAKELAEKFYYHRLLGFDFCVDIHGNIKLIEVNNKNNEINFYQMNNGPLFKEYTKEIIEYCLKNKRTIIFDYEV